LELRFGTAVGTSVWNCGWNFGFGTAVWNCSL